MGSVVDTVKKNYEVFLKWAGLTLLLGQLGVIASALFNLKAPMGMMTTLREGHLYTFAIACLGGSLFDFVRDIGRYRGSSLKKLSTTAALAFVVACLGSLLLGLERSTPLPPYVQVLTWLSAILLAFLALVFALQDAGSYKEQTDRSFDKTKRKARTITHDRRGVAL